MQDTTTQDKQCRKCRQIKPLIDFPKSSRSKDKHDSVCKKCNNEIKAKWGKDNPESLNQSRMKDTAKRKLARALRVKKSGEDKAEQSKAMAQQWQIDHPESVAASSRKSTKNYKAAHPEKVRAQRLVRQAKRSGLLKEQPCESCGIAPDQTKMHAHHDDYSEPLKIRWLCGKCHKEHHNQHKKRKIMIKGKSRLKLIPRLNGRAVSPNNAVVQPFLVLHVLVNGICLRLLLSRDRNAG